MSIASPTDITCMVFPPRLDKVLASISLGMAIRCTGKPCKSNFSIGMIGLPMASATTTLPGVNVGEMPVVRSLERPFDWDTSAMTCSFWFSALTDCQTSTCRHVDNAKCSNGDPGLLDLRAAFAARAFRLYARARPNVLFLRQQHVCSRGWAAVGSGRRDQHRRDTENFAALPL